MKGHQAVRRCLFVSLILLATTVGPQPMRVGARSSPEADAEELFRNGLESAIEGRVRPIRLPGCRDCHGRDGGGGREGDVVAPPISVATLDRASLDRPAYDEAAFSSAVRDGLGSDGRRLRALMPRYPISPEQVGALRRFLTRLDRCERHGVEVDRVRIGVDMRAGRRLYDGMVAALGAGLSFHGRRLELVPVHDHAAIDRGDLFALVFSTDLGLRKRDCGMPLLFPIPPLDEDTRPDEARSLAPSRRDQAESLLGIAPASVPVVADDAGRDLLPAGNTRPLLDLSNLTHPDMRPREILVFAAPSVVRGLIEVLPPGARIYGIGSEIGPILPELVRRGLKVAITDPSAGPSVQKGRPAAERLSRVTVELMRIALLSAGRDLTRGKLFQAFDRIRLDGADWPSLDYVRHARTGRRTVQILADDQ